MSGPGVLGRETGYRYLWGARTLSVLGDTFTTVALVLYAARLANAGTLVGLLLVAQSLPRILGPLAGAIADRVDHRRLMVGCELGQAALIGTVALTTPPFPVVLGLVASAALLSTLFQPAGRSTVPVLVATDAVPAANALLSSGTNLALALGPAIAGLLVGPLGVRGALALDALTFVASSLLLSRLPPLPPTRHPDEPASGVLASTRAGLAYVAGERVARAVAIGLFLVVIFGALRGVALVFLAEGTPHTGQTGYGLLSSAYGIGLVAGPLGLLRRGRRLAPARGLLLGIGLMAVGSLMLGTIPSLAIALVCQLLMGLGNGLENIGNDTLIQRGVPRAIMGRVFGIVYTCGYGAAAITYALGGPLLGLLSPRGMFIACGLGTLGALVIVSRLLPPFSYARDDGAG
jgi:MFS family permease